MTSDAGVDFMRSVARVRRIFAIGIGIVAFAWCVVVPALEVWQRYGEARIEAETRLSLTADRISAHIAAHPDTWEFEAVRLPSLVQDVIRGSRGDIVSLLLLDDAGREVMAWRREDERPQLYFAIQEPVTDGRRPVGRLVMEISFDSAIVPALVAGLAGLSSALLLLGLVRLIGKRALDRALNMVGETSKRLALRVEELEEARAELGVQLAARDHDQKLLASHAASLDMASQDLTHVAQLAAHHLQEPLRTILSFSQLLVRRADEGVGDKAECVSFIRSGVRRMQSQLLALSAYLALRDGDGEPEIVRLGATVSDVAAMLAPELAAVGARLQWAELPEVQAYPSHMQMLFRDLIQNALRHRRVDDTLEIWVEAEAQGDQWLLTVSDNGLPLEHRDPARMFHLLVHNEEGGMGGGLASCRRIVLMLGGVMWAERRWGGGAAIRFLLPVIGTGASYGAGKPGERTIRRGGNP